MKTFRSRLAIADPSLADARGHHYTLSLQITRGARSWGMDVVWFVHKDFVAPISLEGVAVYPVFSATMYDRYRPEKKGALPANLDQRLLDELNEGISQAGLVAEDHIYFHTGFGDLYRAIPGYARDAELHSKPNLHVCTPYDLDTMPGKDPGTALLDIFKRLRTVEAIDKKIFFWAETPQLASHYTQIYGFNVRAMPLPPPDKIDNEPAAMDADVLTAIYLGAARQEKGFLLLPQLVERLYEPYGKNGKLRFVIQCTPQIVGYIPSIKAAIERLACYPAEYVRLIDVALDEPNYHSELDAADIVLLLYEPKNYKIRGSGIAVEAICADKCILTHKKTFCASLITHGGGCAVENLDEAVAKLSEIVVKKYEYLQKAKLQGQQYRMANSAKRYVEKIMRQAEPDHRVQFFPSSIIGYVSPPLLKPR